MTNKVLYLDQQPAMDMEQNPCVPNRERIVEERLEVLLAEPGLVRAIDNASKDKVRLEMKGNAQQLTFNQKVTLKRNLLKDLMAYRCNGRGMRRVKRFYSRGSNEGRQYAHKPSLSTLNRRLRSYLTYDLLLDLDIANAFFVILSHVCKHHGIECQFIDGRLLDQPRTSPGAHSQAPVW